MKNRCQEFVVKFPIYEYVVRVQVCRDVTKEANVGPDVKAFAELQPRGTRIVLPRRKAGCFGLAVHEAYHAICNLEKYISEKRGDMDEESFAYHLQNLVSHIDKKWN